MPRIPALPFKGVPSNNDYGVVYDVSTQTTKYSTYEDIFNGVNATSGVNFSVTNYGAAGDGVTDDTAAIQACINAAQTAGGGTIFFPATTASYLMKSGITFTLSSLTTQMKVVSYGGQLQYTGSGDAITINTNISGFVQSAQKSVHWEGLNIVGTSLATSAIKLVGASFCSFKDTLIDSFTGLPTNGAAIVFDASFTNWCEENSFIDLDIRNTGYGICFISENDSAGVASSCANNQFTNCHIWVTQTGGKGIYGVGKGASNTVQVSRSNFETIVVHVASANNVIAYDFSNITITGTNWLGPSVDITGACASLVGWKYTYNGSNDVLNIFGPTAFPAASLSTWYTGGGKFNIMGGNLSNYFVSDTSGNLTALSLAASLVTTNTGIMNNLAVASTASINNLALNSPLPVKSGGTNATNLEQFYYPAITTGSLTSYGAYLAAAIGTNVSAYFNFTIPAGAATYAAADFFLLNSTTTTINFNMNAYSGGNGQSFSTLLTSLATTAVPVTLNQITTKSVLSAMPTLVPGNAVGVQFTSNTNFNFLLGLRVRYQ